MLVSEFVLHNYFDFKHSPTDISQKKMYDPDYELVMPMKKGFSIKASRHPIIIDTDGFVRQNFTGY
jgi:hypothetical protein